MPNEQTVWGIHGGRYGEADSLFLERGVIAIGSKVGDLSAVPADREVFKSLFAGAHPDRKPGAIPVHAGVLFRLRHEAQVGDLVVYPSKRDKRVHVGRITGEYQFAHDYSPEFPHRRAVHWLAEVPRTRFSQGALYEIGSAVTLFQVRNYAVEFRAVAEGKAPAEAPTEDETTAVVTQEIEQTARDFILKQLATELKGHPLAEFVAHLLGAMGYRTRVSPEGPDSGVDIVAHKDELGFEPPIVKVQVKSTEGSVGDPIASQLYGKVAEGEYGLLVTLGTFSAQARAFERSKSNLRLIDGDQLVDLVLEHYESFDSRYKGLLPLKRVWVPEPLDGTGE